MRNKAGKNGGELLVGTNGKSGRVDAGTKGDLTTNQIFAIKESVFKPGRIWLAGAGPGIAYTNSPAGEITNLVHP